MKKLKLFLIVLLFLLLMPYIVNAKEACTIVSGNGKDIGSEIACGSEHFYIFENNDDNIKMLSKYNLYVGANYNKIKLNIDDTYMRYECISGECRHNGVYYFEGEQVATSDEWEYRIKQKYDIDYFTYYTDAHETAGNNLGNVAYITTIEGDTYIEDGKTYQKKTYKLYPYVYIASDMEGYALQNPLSIGVYGEKGNATYPIYSTFIPFSASNYSYTRHYGSISNQITNLDNFEVGYTNFDFVDDTIVSKYLSDYKTNLTDMGYNVLSVDILGVKEINNFVKTVSGSYLPLRSWYDSVNGGYDEDLYDVEEDEDGQWTELGSLKEHVSNDYSWLWGTSYWTKTLVGDVDLSPEVSFYNFFDYYIYFVTTAGDICFSSGDCMSGIPRAGLRPLVTLEKENIKYKILTKTDGNGTIEVVDSAYGGDSISFKVSANKGLKVSGLTVTTDSNETVEFSEEDISIDDTGVYSISTNLFTMPFENVTIEARWVSEKINPGTGTMVSLMLIIEMLGLGMISYFIIKHKRNYILK